MSQTMDPFTSSDDLEEIIKYAHMHVSKLISLFEQQALERKNKQIANQRSDEVGFVLGHCYVTLEPKMSFMKPAMKEVVNYFNTPGLEKVSVSTRNHMLTEVMDSLLSSSWLVDNCLKKHKEGVHQNIRYPIPSKTAKPISVAVNDLLPYLKDYWQALIVRAQKEALVCMEVMHEVSLSEESVIVDTPATPLNSHESSQVRDVSSIHPTPQAPSKVKP